MKKNGTAEGLEFDVCLHCFFSLIVMYSVRVYPHAYVHSERVPTSVSTH